MTPAQGTPSTPPAETAAGPAPGPAEEATLSLGHGDLHVCLDGPRHAPALLLVHGSAATARSWDWLVPLLTSSHRVVRVDLPGHGRSPAPADGDFATAAQARAVGAALERLGIGHAVVVGHSSGGYTATALAGQRPGLVTALALINTGPALEAFIAPESGPPDPADWPPSDEELRRFASSGFRDGFEIPQEFVEQLRTLDLRASAAAMRGSLAYLKEQALPARLAPLGTPLQVIFGDQDRRWLPSSAADYRAVPGADVTMLPGSGHTPIIEDPAGTAAPLLAFTARHRGPRT
ncbi:alpha/beta fold hydrolase [Streptomyces sp. NPDC004111]|uniref:alpha/beta fold hydrolase n=1 Tax=Streptomyces sp. NPDC004111 TaxID=3364690 RepID=UPI0036CC8A65